MNIKLLNISGEQLKPPNHGLPDDLEHFDVLIELEWCFEGHETDSVFFEFYVASTSALLERPINSFMPPTLVIKEFDWDVIKQHTDKMLHRTRRCQSWSDVITKLNGQIRPVCMSSFSC